MSTTTELRLDDQLCFALYAASNSIVRAYRPLLSELGLTYPQYLVMMALWEHGELSPHEIGQRLDLPPNGVAPVTRRLVDAGLVSRAPDHRDGRAVRVRLTTAGRELEQAAARAQAAVLVRTGLSEHAARSLRASLGQLRAAVADEYDPTGTVGTT